MSTKHTPGPWSLNQYGEPVDAAGENIRAKGLALTNSEEAKANSALIAAAPDLLRQLDLQVRNCPVCKGTGMAVDVFEMLMTEPPHREGPCQRCSDARAVIAKAQAKP